MTALSKQRDFKLVFQVTYTWNGIPKKEILESSTFRILSNRVDRSQAKIEKKVEYLKAEQEKFQIQQKIVDMMTALTNPLEEPVSDEENE